MSYSQRFLDCLAEVLRWEGGWSDDPYDPGGATTDPADVRSRRIAPSGPAGDEVAAPGRQLSIAERISSRPGPIARRRVEHVVVQHPPTVGCASWH